MKQLKQKVRKVKKAQERFLISGLPEFSMEEIRREAAATGRSRNKVINDLIESYYRLLLLGTEELRCHFSDIEIQVLHRASERLPSLAMSDHSNYWRVTVLDYLESPVNEIWTNSTLEHRAAKAFLLDKIGEMTSMQAFALARYMTDPAAKQAGFPKLRPVKTADEKGGAAMNLRPS